ncbi:hypothetical protein VKT23_009842 [Stygiomarasmius scandens]|uniref:Uncharacterized protein n=1 Tax=Marasmiellus scandens TaxID=2682957 RepID=A0ABR1JDH8_9AGAR
MNAIPADETSILEFASKMPLENPLKGETYPGVTTDDDSEEALFSLACCLDSEIQQAALCKHREGVYHKVAMHTSDDVDNIGKVIRLDNGDCGCDVFMFGLSEERSRILLAGFKRWRDRYDSVNALPFPGEDPFPSPSPARSIAAATSTPEDIDQCNQNGNWTLRPSSSSTKRRRNSLDDTEALPKAKRHREVLKSDMGEGKDEAVETVGEEQKDGELETMNFIDSDGKEWIWIDF